LRPKNIQVQVRFFGSGEYGSVDFLSSFDFAADITSGALCVDRWENVDSEGAGVALTW
jgi:hypothetical protein